MNNPTPSNEPIAPAIHERKGHTPGPYLHDGVLLYALDETGQVNRMSARFDGGYIGNRNGRTTDAELEATAEFAQRACNSHYEMLAALEMARVILMGTRPGFCMKPGGKVVSAGQALAAVEDAITKAEG